MKVISIAPLILMLLGMSDATIVQHWNYRVIRGKSFMLECNDLRRNGTYDNMHDFSWIFPDLMIHIKGYTDGNVLVEGKTVSIGNLNESLEGIYHCQYNTMNGTEKIPQIVKRGINYGGPAYETRLDEYAMKLVAGFVALIILLISTIVLCLAYECHWFHRRQVLPVVEEGGKTGTHYGSEQETNLRADNPAFDMSDSELKGESDGPMNHRDSVRPEQFRKASQVLGEQNLPRTPEDDADDGTKATDDGVDNPELDGEEPHKELRKSPETLEEENLPTTQTDAAVLMVSSL